MSFISSAGALIYSLVRRHMLQILVVTQSAKRRFSSRPLAPAGTTTSIINRATRPKTGQQHKKAQIKLEKMDAKLLEPQTQEVIQASRMMTWRTVEHKEPHAKEEIKEEQQPQHAVIESKQSNTSS